MPHLFLPADHADRDLVLAGQVAELVGSAELYVTWTDAAGQTAAEVAALMREPAHPLVRAVDALICLVASLLSAAFNRAPREALSVDLPDPLAPAGQPRARPAAGETA